MTCVRDWFVVGSAAKVHVLEKWTEAVQFQRVVLQEIIIYKQLSSVIDRETDFVGFFMN